ncbi:MAG TPA: crosslink repair DNA glycosylase YcaQ family protein [Pseudonocardiaceae bacterium]|nr:crosslink repair DNA glycosylase YcaQ family protein [Pseudonocardiaceae bacterium]
MAPIRVDRATVLAYRALAHGLDRTATDPLALGVLDIGVQETRGSAQQALAARLSIPVPDPTEANGPLVLLWAARGAPHVHRRTDLAALAAVLWPHTDADAMTRLSSERAALKAAGIGGLAAYTAAATAVREVVTEPLPKGTVSAAVTKKLPAAYAYTCRSCATDHVYGNIFQLVGSAAGVYHHTPTPKLTLAPLPDRPPIPTEPEGTQDFLRAYLRLHGPATLAEAAGYLGTAQQHARPLWPDGLAEIEVDGKTCWLPEDQVPVLRKATAPEYVRLLPPLDPYLQARDRDLIVPDPARQREVWRILGNPGAVYVNGELVGVWRAKTAGKTLNVAVDPLAKLSTKDKKALESEAHHLAATRALPNATVTINAQ